MKKFMLIPFLLAVSLLTGIMAQGDTPLPPSEDTDRKTANDRLADIGESMAGFGGMYIDSANPNVLNVFLLDTNDATQKEDAEDAIGNKFPGIIPSGGIVVVEGQYSMSQLTSWYVKVIEALTSANLDKSKLVGFDLEEDKNRVEIAVKDEDTVAVVEAALAGLDDVPRDAFRVTIRNGFRFRTTVRARIRPVVEGIHLQGEDQGHCTIGFVAIRSGNYGVTTNSHCNEEYSSVESTVFYQEKRMTMTTG